MTRGHSNAMVDRVIAISTTQAQVPIHGGATVTTYRELPPLILTEKEWRIIGDKMNWNKKRQSTRG